MDFGSLIIFGAAIVAMLVIGARREHLRRLGKPSSFADVANALGLLETERGHYRGEREGMAIHVASAAGEEDSGYTIEVSSPEIPPKLQLKQETISAAIFGEEDISVGDPSFDARVLVQGDLLAAVSLTRAARAAWIAVPSAVSLNGGMVSTRARVLDVDLLPRVEETIQLAKLLACPEDQLIERALGALRAARGARALALFAELRSRANPASFARAVEVALAHPDVDLRVAGAACSTGDVAEMLLELVADPKTSDAARARALDLLAEKSRLPERERLAELIGNAGPKTLRVLARLAGAQGLSVEAIEVKVIALVESSHGERRVSAIELLAELGTSRALEALENASRGLTVPGDVKSAAKRALAAIETRRRASAGHLAIADGDGSLSLSAPVGSLSRAEERTPISED